MEMFLRGFEVYVEIKLVETLALSMARPASWPRTLNTYSVQAQITATGMYISPSISIARCNMIPWSYMLDPPVKAEEARVSRAVVPPSAISQAVHIANLYEKAAVARLSGEEWSTTRTHVVNRLF